MSAPVLAVDALSKRYCRDLRRSILYGLADIARELAPRAGREPRLRPGEFWGLDDVSFGLAPGEAIAVIGHNGAGKSTLLKILCGLIKPDRGEARLSGSVEALIELGTGLNPVLTGRENLELGAALRGISGAGVRRLVDEVTAFAGLEAFVDAPLQSYSSGMKARLGYALSAYARPDLLLVDEVLAVGDLAFQHKCLLHMRRYIAEGGALLLVSHNVHQIQAVCSRGLLLRQGRLAYDGTAVEALNRHIAERPEPAAAVEDAPAEAGPIVIRDLAAEPVGSALPATGESLRFVIRYAAERKLDVVGGISIWTEDQWVCATSIWERDGRTVEAGEGELSCLVPRMPLLGGRYLVRAAILDRATRHPLALYGYRGGGLVLDIASPADAFTNLQVQRGHLVELDAEWR